MEINGEISYHLQGIINVAYNDKLYNVTDARLTILLGEGDIVATIKLVIELSEASINKLATYFHDMKAFNEGYYSYAFLMKEDILDKNQELFASAIELDDWLKAGEGLCLKLENYDFKGYAKI